MRLKKFHHILIGIAIGVMLVTPLAVFLFVKSGIYDVGACLLYTI